MKRKGQNRFILCCLAPAVILFIIFMIIPTFNVFRMSLYKWGGYTAEKTFVGLDNFFKLFQNDRFYRSFQNSILLIVLVTIVTFSHTGGTWWENPVISTMIKQFVHNGGGLIGVGEPSGHQAQGRYIQLASVLGVEKETGFTLGYDKYNWECAKYHFILEDQKDEIDFGEGKNNMFALEKTTVLVQREKEVQMAVHEFGEGRSVYISGLPYSFSNSRLLYRAILWSCHGEDQLLRWFSTNGNTEVHAYPQNHKFCVVNNTYEPQETVVYKGDGSSFVQKLAANEIIWMEV